MTTYGAVARLAEEMANEGSRLKKRAAVAAALSSVYHIGAGSDDLRLFCLYLRDCRFQPRTHAS